MNPRRNKPFVLLLGLVVAVMSGLSLNAQTPPASTSAVETVSIPQTEQGEVAPAPEKGDPIAARFLNTCAGCHSLDGVKLTGPDLSPVAAWPEAQLMTAIKRMEVKVGPLADADVESFAKFLQSVDLRPRLAAETERIRSQFAAKLEVGSSVRGQALFAGREPFSNGGLSCVACHQVSGQGGRLGPDLTGVYAKMGELPLMSSLDKVGFKIMAAHYQRHPITRQEAVHLVAYMKTLDPASASQSPTTRSTPTVIGLALAGFSALVAYGSRGLVTRSRKLEYRKH